VSSVPSVSDPSWSIGFRRNWPFSSEWAGGLQGIVVNAVVADSPPRPQLTSLAGLMPAMCEAGQNIGNFAGPAAQRRDMTAQFSTPTVGLYSHPLIAQTRMLSRQQDPGNASVQSGLQLGSFGVGPAALPANPWAATNARDVIQLFCDNAGGWWLRINTSTTPTLTLTPLAGVDAPNSLTQTYHLMIVHSPGLYVAGYINGVEGVRVVSNVPNSNARQAQSVGIYNAHQGAAVDIIDWFLNPTLLIGGLVK